jgi:hypothetical protein
MRDRKEPYRRPPKTNRFKPPQCASDPLWDEQDGPGRPRSPGRRQDRQNGPGRRPGWHLVQTIGHMAQRVRNGPRNPRERIQSGGLNSVTREIDVVEMSGP